MAKVTEEELLEDLEAVARDLGEVPSRRQYREHPGHSHAPQTFSRRIGPMGWATAKERVRGRLG